MKVLSFLNPKARLQQLKGWLEKPFKGWFNDKDVRVLSSHKNASLKPTAGWQYRQHLRERRVTQAVQKAPLIPPSEEDKLQDNIELKEKALTELRALLKQQVFTRQVQAYKEGNRNLLIVLQKLKTYASQNNWQKVSEILRHHMPLLQVNDFDPVLREYERINKMADVLPPPELPPEKIPGPVQPEPMQIMNPDSPVSIPSAAKQLTPLDNGQVNLFLGDITEINQKVHPCIETLVCPHRANSQRSTTILTQLALLEPDLNDWMFKKRMQEVNVGDSIITMPGKIAEKGFTSLVHTVLPECWDNLPNARLLGAYVSAIRQAHKQGSASIAIPILSRYLNLTVEQHVQLARIAIQYYLKNLDDTPGPPPKIYLVFPDNLVGTSMRNQHMTLNITKPLLDFNPDNRAEHNAVSRLRLERILNPILPARNGLDITGRMQWLSQTVDNAIAKLDRHEDPGEDGKDLLDYIDNAREALERNPSQLDQDEKALAKNYLINFEKRLAPYIHHKDD